MQLIEKGFPWLAGSDHLSLFLDAFRSVRDHLRDAPRRLRQFVDARLLISAQTTSIYANALYGASALDLPRRGVVHLECSMGAIAKALEQALCQNGGRISTNQPASFSWAKIRVWAVDGWRQHLSRPIHASRGHGRAAGSEVNTRGL